MSDTDGDSSMIAATIRLFETGNFADATIICGDRDWSVHKLILSSRCKWFETAFYGHLKESKSGKIVLEEQEPDLVGIMLHFIYAKDIDIPKLAEGKDISGLCVRLFRLGDFFLLEELKEKAMTELNAHFENTLIFLKTEAENDENPAWLTEILEAIEDAYKDRSTAPILETLLKFVCRNKHKIFQFKDAIGLFDKLPELVKDLLKNGIFHDIAAHPRPHEFRLGLPVLAASQGPDHFYESSYAKPCPIRPTKLPCLLYPAVEISGPVFTAMNPETGGEFDGLGWLTPRASAVRAIVYDPGSALVRVEMHRWDASSLSIRFDDSGDSRLFVERYLRSNPEIFQRRPKKSVLSKRNRRKMPVPDPSDDD